MSKKEWFETWVASKRGDITVKFTDSGIAWAGFWIGAGIVIAAAVIKGQVVIKL